MSDEDTGILQGPRRQSKGKGRASSASNPPASPSRAPPTPGASQPPLGTAGRAGLEQNSGFTVAAADAAANELQSVRDFAAANPDDFAGSEHDDELRTQPAEAAAASAPEAAATPAATAAAAAIEAATNPAAAGGAGRLALLDQADNDGAAPGFQTAAARGLGPAARRPGAERPRTDTLGRHAPFHAGPIRHLVALHHELRHR